MNTPENIQTLKENEIFVFGSNMNGNHTGGAAKLAVEKFGAVMGQAEGIQGQSYAIPTLDKNMQKVSIKDLEISLGNFRKYAENNPDKTFYLTKIGCGIARFDTNEMAYQVLKAKLPDNVILPKEFTYLIGYKGFDSHLTCRDYKYEVGKNFKTEGNIKVCKNGFHFCLNPMDVFSFYPPAVNCRYCKVVGKGNIDVRDTKVAVSDLYISREVYLDEMLCKAKDYIQNNAKNRITSYSDSKIYKENYLTLTATPNKSPIVASIGNCSFLANCGENGITISDGIGSMAYSSGTFSTSLSTRSKSIAQAIGHESIAIATDGASAAISSNLAIAAGHNSIAKCTEALGMAVTANANSISETDSYGSVAISTGLNSTAVVKGKYSIAISTGQCGIAKGALGCWLVLTGYTGDDNLGLEVKAFKVDGKTIKANTYYTLENGKPVVAEN